VPQENSNPATTPTTNPAPKGSNQNAGASSGPELTQEHLEFINTLRSTFAPQSGQSNQTPAQQRAKRLKELTSEVDDAVLRSIRAGNSGMPVTSKIAYELSETSEHLLNENQELKKEIEQLKVKTAQMADPAYRGITQISDTAELMVADAVDALYGEVDANDPRASMVNRMKEHQRESFHTMIYDHIQDLVAKQDIKSLKALQKPNNLRKLVSDLGEVVLPPKARDILKAEALANMPVDPKALYAEMVDANKKAAEAKTPAEQRQWEDIATRARRRYLGTRLGRKR
jgi:hypothetical protein